MAALNALTLVAEQMATLVSQRLGSRAPEPDLIPGVPLGGASEALIALRAAASGTLEGHDLSMMAETLDALGAAAGLSPVDKFVLALLVLANVDDRIGRAVGLLHDDVSRTRPSIGLCARVCAALNTPVGDPVGRERVLEAAGLESTLVHRGLVDHAGMYGDRDAPVANRELVLNPRVLMLLINGGPLGAPEPRLTSAMRLESAAAWAANDAEGSPMKTLVHDLARISRAGRPTGILCVGPDPDGAVRFARAFAQVEQLRTLRVDVTAALALGETLESLPRTVRRESIVLQALPIWTQLPPREALAEAALARRLANMLAEAPSPLIVHAEHLWTPPADLQLTLVHVATPTPTFVERVAVWRAADRRTPIPTQAAEELAAAFMLTPSAVAAAGAEASAATVLLGGDYQEQLRRAAHRQTSSRIVRFATKITPRAKWTDIKAPGAVIQQLKEIESRAANRARIVDRAGGSFRGRPGFLALLVGASGTGKTLAAEIIAREQGFDLYKVDLAALVSKYIGDTEKNLSEVFEAAESAHAILFFDEADAVFGRRAEVRDAHDRYANQEVNYLLQRVESYEGVILLATNLRQNMDDAFLRRLDLVVELPFPDAPLRTDIWKAVWPEHVKPGPEVNLAEFSRFRLSGGSIRNVAVDAMFRAAGRDPDAKTIIVRRADLVLALGREYQKLGRPITRAEFGDDYKYVVDTLFSPSTEAGVNVA